MSAGTVPTAGYRWIVPDAPRRADRELPPRRRVAPSRDRPDDARAEHGARTGWADPRRPGGARAAVHADRRGAAHRRRHAAPCAGSRALVAAAAFPGRSDRSTAPGCGSRRSAAQRSRRAGGIPPCEPASRPRRRGVILPAADPAFATHVARRRAGGHRLQRQPARRGDPRRRRGRRPARRSVPAAAPSRRALRVGEDLGAVREPRRARVRPLGRTHRRAAARACYRVAACSRRRRSSSTSTWRSTATSI